jgi:hypothetical protein
MAGTGPLYTSISQISSINSLTYVQKQDYTKSWNTYRSIELYNSNVSTQHGLGNADIDYWKYTNYTEIAAYQTGQIMFVTYLGYTSTVQKN